MVCPTRHRGDLLDETEPLRRPVLGSVVFHAAVFLAAAGYNYLHGGPRNPFGDPNSLGGGSVMIQPVSQIPLPPRGGVVNRVANDTESMVPRPPKPQPKQQKQPDADAIELQNLRKKDEARRKQTTAQNRYVPPQAARPNQVYSSSGAAISSPLYGTTGSGGVGLGAGNPFGNRFGYYAALVRERVAQKWQTAEVDARLKTAPPVIVTFDIRRDGSVSNVRLLQRSGNVQLDYSCQRAILDAAPFPALPAGYERDSANIEFWFQLER
jgi:periplasmic protein TonB